jgi:tripartite-type tricarboxylate transporter receptor subunit TctC
LRSAFDKVLKDQTIRKQFEVQGWVIKGDGPDSVRKLVDDDIRKYGQIINELNIKID